MPYDAKPFPWKFEPHRLVPPSTRPSPTVPSPYRAPTQRPMIPPDAQHFEFNGVDVYLIPLRLR
jgi:hypothetical protein